MRVSAPCGTISPARNQELKVSCEDHAIRIIVSRRHNCMADLPYLRFKWNERPRASNTRAEGSECRWQTDNRVNSFYGLIRSFERDHQGRNQVPGWSAR